MNPIEIMKSFSRAQAGIAGLASAMSLVGGAALGAAIAMKKLSANLEVKYAELSEKEIAEAKAFYSRHYKSEQFSTVEGTVEALRENGKTIALEQAAMAMLTYQGAVAAEEILEDEPETQLVEVARNVFTDSSPTKDFDYEKEIEKRDPDRPYVISKAEFEQDEFSYDQAEYTFYEGDGVLTNERDQVIDNQEDVVGIQNLTMFGYGSEDANMVYIRNVKIGLDCLILRSQGEYAKEVLGFIEHSHKPTLRRFRAGDDV